MFYELPIFLDDMFQIWSMKAHCLQIWEVNNLKNNWYALSYSTGMCAWDLQKLQIINITTSLIIFYQYFEFVRVFSL